MRCVVYDRIRWRVSRDDGFIALDLHLPRARRNYWSRGSIRPLLVLVQRGVRHLNEPRFDGSERPPTTFGQHGEDLRTHDGPDGVNELVGNRAVKYQVQASHDNVVTVVVVLRQAYFNPKVSKRISSSRPLARTPFALSGSAISRWRPLAIRACTWRAFSASCPGCRRSQPT
jgi:hypothetical protein